MHEIICPHCKKPIHDDDALLCLYCGEGLNTDSSFGFRNKFIIALVALIVLVGFVAFLIK